MTQSLKISLQFLPFLVSHCSSQYIIYAHRYAHVHRYNIFSCHLGEHEAGNMNLRMNSSKQLAHRLFQELICLYLETLFGIYVQGLGCIWKESSLKHLPLKERWANIIGFFFLNPGLYFSGEIIWFILCPFILFILTPSSAQEAGMGLGCSPDLGVCSGGRKRSTFMPVRRLSLSPEATALSPTCVWNGLKCWLWSEPWLKKGSTGSSHHAQSLKISSFISVSQRPRLFCDVGSSIFSVGTEDTNDGSNAHSKFYRFQNAFADGLS